MLFVVLFLYSYTRFQVLSPNIIHGIKISRLFPLIDSSGKVFRYDPVDTKIWYSGNQICYESSYQYSANNNFDDFEKSPKYHQVFYSFTYTKGNRYGLYSDSARKITDKEVAVDSMLKKEWAVQKDFGMWFDKKLIKLELLHSKQSSDTAEDYYAFRNVVDTTMTGRLTLGYSKDLLRIKEYSFSGLLDSLKKMKLCRVRMFYNARIVGSTHFHMDVMDIPYWLEEIKPDSASYVKRMFSNEKMHKYLK